MFVSFLSVLEYIIPFLVVLTVLVFFHELGHYYVARRCGVKIEVFSIGFGPEIFGWNDKAGTRWKFSLLPFGGYVKMYGDVEPSGQAVNPELSKMPVEEKALTLQGRPPAQRIAIAGAGPIANYILAIFLLMGVFLFKGAPMPTTEVGNVAQGSVAESLGLQPKDVIVRVNGAPTKSFNELREALSSLKGKEIKLDIERSTPTTEGILEAGKSLTLLGKMVDKAPSGQEKPTAILGITSGGVIFESIGLLESLQKSVTMCVNISLGMLELLGKIVTGQSSAEGLGGVLAIGHNAKEFASKGLVDLVVFMAILSINLGMFNLLPIPVVDGGHIAMYTLEILRGKPLSEKTQERIFTIGLLFILSLFVFTTWLDLEKFKIFEFIVGSK